MAKVNSREEGWAGLLQGDGVRQGSEAEQDRGCDHRYQPSGKHTRPLDNITHYLWKQQPLPLDNITHYLWKQGAWVTTQLELEGASLFTLFTVVT